MIVGLVSEAFQEWGGASEGEALRFGLVIATAGAGLLGIAFMERATRYAAADVQATLNEFMRTRFGAAPEATGSDRS